MGGGGLRGRNELTGREPDPPLWQHREGGERKEEEGPGSGTPARARGEGGGGEGTVVAEPAEGAGPAISAALPGDQKGRVEIEGVRETSRLERGIVLRHRASGVPGAESVP